MVKTFIAAGHEAHVVIFRDVIQLLIPDRIKIRPLDKAPYAPALDLKRKIYATIPDAASEVVAGLQILTQQKLVAIF